MWVKPKSFQAFGVMKVCLRRKGDCGMVTLWQAKYFDVSDVFCTCTFGVSSKLLGWRPSLVGWRPLLVVIRSY